MESNEQELTGIPAAIASLKPGIDYAPADGPNPLARQNQRDIPEDMLERVEAIVAKANKRAVKLGVAVHTRRVGLLTSLVSAYDRANEERVVREKRVNA